MEKPKVKTEDIEKVAGRTKNPDLKRSIQDKIKQVQSTKPIRK